MPQFTARIKAAISAAALTATLVGPAATADASVGRATCARSISVGSVAQLEGTTAPPMIGFRLFSFVVKTAITAQSVAGCRAPATAVRYNTSPVTADSYDYNSVAGSLSWTTGDTTSRTIVVHVRADTTPECDDSFAVVVHATSVGAPTVASGHGVIRNDDYGDIIGWHCTG